jgi:hypothetical protein
MSRGWITSIVNAAHGAIRRALRLDKRARRKAADDLLATEPVLLPEDPAALKREIRDYRYGRHSRAAAPE